MVSVKFKGYISEIVLINFALAIKRALESRN